MTAEKLVRKLLGILTIGSVLLALSGGAAVANDKDDDGNRRNTSRVAVCAHPGTPAEQTRLVRESKVDRYLRKGALLGACEDTVLNLLNQIDGAQALLAALALVEESGGGVPASRSPRGTDTTACLGIQDVLADVTARVTLLVPVNGAFEMFLRRKPGEFDGLSADEIKDLLPLILMGLERTEGDLCDVLLNHVATGPEPRTVEELLEAGAITVDNGPEFPISVGKGDVKVNYESEFSVRDRFATNGIMHFLNSVIANEPPAPPPGSDGLVTVFITNGTYSGGIPAGLAGRDAACQSEAAEANLPGTWTAWLSDSTMNAKNRVADGEYRNVSGALIANDMADLTDALLASPIFLNQYGNNVDGLYWTGTLPDGTAATVNSNCEDWTNTDAVNGECSGDDINVCGSTGNSNKNNGEWTNSRVKLCYYQYHLLCFSD